MQSCAEGGKSGFPDMKKKNVPDTVSLKKGGENGSRTKHVQCEPFFMNRIYQRIRGWKESDLTETGEIVRDFWLLTFSLYCLNSLWTCIAFAARGMHTWELVCPRPIKILKIDETKRERHVDLSPHTSLLSHSPDSSHLSTSRTPQPSPLPFTPIPGAAEVPVRFLWRFWLPKVMLPSSSSLT